MSVDMVHRRSHRHRRHHHHKHRHSHKHKKPSPPKPVVCPPPKPPPKPTVCPPPKPVIKPVDAPSLGIIRLDYDYPAVPGDIDHPDSFGYDVYYKVVPGFTFEMCQSGKMTLAVRNSFISAINWLVKKKKVKAITGDCGFMMYFQKLARHTSNLPVFMSALCVLPAVTCAFSRHEQILIMTANGETLKPMRDLIRDECGVDTQATRYHIIGCQDVRGFEAVATGGKVDYDLTVPGIVDLAVRSLRKFPKSRAFLLECTELPQFADAIRYATGLPVYDAITACDFFMEGYLDNERFGLDDWQEDWDGVQEEYKFGDNLTRREKRRLVNKL